MNRCSQYDGHLHFSPVVRTEGYVWLYILLVVVCFRETAGAFLSGASFIITEMSLRIYVWDYYF
jgi:hypothetical protein